MPVYLRWFNVVELHVWRVRVNYLDIKQYRNNRIHSLVRVDRSTAPLAALSLFVCAYVRCGRKHLHLAG